MADLSRKDFKRVLLYLWSGVAIGLVLATIIFIAQPTLNTSLPLRLVVMLLMIPSGIASFYLYFDLLTHFGFRLLWLLPLLLFPVVFFVAIALAPFVYLVYVTSGYFKYEKA